MVKCTEESKIYVHVQAGVVTGGIELLHQLVHELRNLGRKAFVVYHGRAAHVVPDDYRVYDLEFTDIVEDSPSNIEVYTETMLHYLGTNHRSTQKFWWWLSVDFFYGAKQFVLLGLWDCLNGRLVRGMRILLSSIRWSKHPRPDLPAYLSSLYGLSHITCGYQCAFIRDFIVNNGFADIVPLGDYINDDHVGTFSIDNRKDIVLYNPKKGLGFVEKLMQLAPDISWCALAGMSREQLRDVMRSAKLYVDFGNHPGMDRLPRECAANGCCVITGKRGSAGYDEDVPLPPGYKFDERQCSLNAIIARIRETLSCYETEIPRFAPYREFVSGQKRVFVDQLTTIFGK
ncbi:MAG: hypothetical protein IJQ73_04235 [Kiritimatiellae bacterium]|nr:hypothetical protein [Kiritimatiellia bacterium]